MARIVTYTDDYDDEGIEEGQVVQITTLHPNGQEVVSHVSSVTLDQLIENDSNLEAVFIGTE